MVRRLQATLWPGQYITKLGSLKTFTVHLARAEEITSTDEDVMDSIGICNVNVDIAGGDKCPGGTIM